MSDIPIGIPGQTTQSDLTWLNVAIGLAFIIFDIGVSTVFRLGAGLSLLVAALRCIGQLAAVATILQQVFDNKNPWTVALISGESVPVLPPLTEIHRAQIVVLNFLGTFETGMSEKLLEFKVLRVRLFYSRQ
jgi:ABC-type iron transport system FetAB permease component